MLITMPHRMHLRSALAATVLVTALCPIARAAEHITLRSGFELDCTRREVIGDHVRLYLMPAAGASTASQPAADLNYLEVPAAAILRSEAIPDPPAAPPATNAASHASPETQDCVTGNCHPERSEGPASIAPATTLTSAEMHELLARAGAAHNIDVDLLASVIHAESNGNIRAVSRTGARGLMQLMPATATVLGVTNSFAPEQNIGGGTAYLDQLLTRYHDNLALALAAYNAGPAAVDRYRDIPPYAETRAYVARVIHEFNRLKLAAKATTATQLAAAK